jgi:hypothetical protein
MTLSRNLPARRGRVRSKVLWRELWHVIRDFQSAPRACTEGTLTGSERLPVLGSEAPADQAGRRATARPLGTIRTGTAVGPPSSPPCANWFVFTACVPAATAGVAGDEPAGCARTGGAMLPAARHRRRAAGASTPRRVQYRSNRSRPAPPEPAAPVHPPSRARAAGRRHYGEPGARWRTTRSCSSSPPRTTRPASITNSETCTAALLAA